MKHWTDSLVRIGACNEAVEWAKAYPSLKAAWKACERADWMLWLLAKSGNPKWGTKEHRRTVRVACACARTVAHLWTDPRSEAAVALAERYGAGEDIARADLAAAGDAAQKHLTDIVRVEYPKPPVATQREIEESKDTTGAKGRKE